LHRCRARGGGSDSSIAVEFKDFVTMIEVALDQQIDDQEELPNKPIL
jgi:hypothetical protein